MNLALKEDLEAVQLETVSQLRAEFQSEIGPVRAQLAEVDSKTGRALDETRQLNERLTKIETARVADETRFSTMEATIRNLEARLTAKTGGGAPGRDPRDPAYRRLAFTNFAAGVDDTAMVETMKGFMHTKCPGERYLYADVFLDAKGNRTNRGFVHFSDQKQVRRVAELVKKNSLKVDGHPDVSVKPALCETDRNRNWALAEAETLVKKSPLSAGKTVTVKKAEGRGVYVNGTAVFTQQPRYARDGQFVGEYKDLKLR